MSEYQYWYCKEVKCMSYVDAATGMSPENQLFSQKIKLFNSESKGQKVMVKNVKCRRCNRIVALPFLVPKNAKMSEILEDDTGDFLAPHEHHLCTRRDPTSIEYMFADCLSYSLDITVETAEVAYTVDYDKIMSAGEKKK